jgi:hypothetical protein
MKSGFILIFVLLAQLSFAQKAIEKTDEIRITGKLKAEKVISVADLPAYKNVKIKDLVVTNHLGEKKGTARKLKGVLLKDILAGVEIQSESPKTLSEFYFVFSASDGYKVVFSWNEIFNTPTGNNIYIVTEKDGKSIAEMEDRILLVTTSDIMTGRRFVKGLAKIEVKRAE